MVDQSDDNRTGFAVNSRILREPLNDLLAQFPQHRVFEHPGRSRRCHNSFSFDQVHIVGVACQNSGNIIAEEPQSGSQAVDPSVEFR